MEIVTIFSLMKRQKYVNKYMYISSKLTENDTESHFSLIRKIAANQ